MRKLLLTVCFAGGILFSAGAFQWPSETESLTLTFGQREEAGMVKGLRFEHPGSVMPLDYGEVVFRHVPGPFSPLPGGDESILVLEHANGFQSVYTGLDSSSAGFGKNRLAAGDYICRPAASDEGLPGGYTFYVRDARLKRLVNPLMLLPGIADHLAPDILSIRLEGVGGQYELTSGSEVPAGTYSVLIRSEDHVSRRNPLVMAPYLYSLYSHGTLQAERRMDALLQAEHALSLQDGTPRETLYNSEGYLNLGQLVLTSGTASLEVSVGDIQGNERTAMFTFLVVR